ncbi:Cellulose biosynthesis protein BcsQ [Arthrobacter subterraneus]|uniref:Cellulose biosynthesis protein BcsQ n=1 Tax=Arthrobacter subterraneus TaxID=335973 RepID=A0A1G8PIF4_9MICC|nr:ParA family protein [Arthrobacter subterraneus]SDI92284.1 Cellulose biosynthesis protein BcsQ [Arthrobacter subterraneus]
MSRGLDRVIAIVNGKGGVGKTTIAANIGGMLAASGYRVLLVDMDPQGNLAEELGYTDADANDDGMALAQTLVFGSEAQPARGIRENLDVLMGGSHLDMAAAGLTLKAQKDPATAKAALAQGLEGLAENYDLIFIDCPPGQETLQQAALAAARWALIPVKTDASSRKGLRDVARRLDAVVTINPDLDLLGIVLFGVNRSARRVSESAREAIRQDLGSGAPIFETAIRHAEAAAQESRERGLLAFELEEAVLAAPKWWELRRGSGQQHDGPRSKSAVGVAEDFQALGEEVVARITESEATSIPTGATGAES